MGEPALAAGPVGTTTGHRGATMTTAITLRPIGQVRGGRAAIVDDGWDRELAHIDLDATRFTAQRPVQ